MNEHFSLEDFESLDVSPCGCGCGEWVNWNLDTETWEPEPDRFRYYIVDPEYKTKGDTIIGIVVDRGTHASP